MATFIGEYNHQLDAKNRIRVPAKLRKELGDEYYFGKGINHTVTILTKAEVEAQLAKLAEVRYADFEKQRSVRAIAKSYVAAVEDNQGRVILPPELRAHALLGKDDKDLVICGAVTRIEIWSKKVFDEYFSEEGSDFDDCVRMLDNF